MAENSKIEWTDHTANFWWGCVKVSDGCKHCYADTLARRYGKKIWGPPATTSRELKKAIWKDLPKWDKHAQSEGKRRRVFVQSMSDFFEDHPQVADWRRDALHLISQLCNLDFLVLTKRPENVNAMIEAGTGRRASSWLADCAHVWIGTSVENQEQADKRIPELASIPAAVRFLSMEPLLGLVDLDLSGSNYGIYGIDWVIVGGESGPNARPMHPDWARAIRDQCQTASVPFFFKQWGEYAPLQNLPADCSVQGMKQRRNWYWHEGIPSEASVKVGKHAAGRLLDGREWNEFPKEEQS
jgi:protein gp37